MFHLTKHPRKPRCIRVSSLFTAYVISTSGFPVTVLNFIEMCYSILWYLTTHGHYRHDCVEIPNLSTLFWHVRLVFHLLPISCPPSWFPGERCVGQSRDYTVENLDPENIGVDTKIMFVSRRVPKLEGGCNYASPRRSCKKKSLRRPRVKRYKMLGKCWFVSYFVRQ